MTFAGYRRYFKQRIFFYVTFLVSLEAFLAARGQSDPVPHAILAVFILPLSIFAAYCVNGNRYDLAPTPEAAARARETGILTMSRIADAVAAVLFAAVAAYFFTRGP